MGLNIQEERESSIAETENILTKIGFVMANTIVTMEAMKRTATGFQERFLVFPTIGDAAMLTFVFLTFGCVMAMKTALMVRMKRTVNV